MKKRYFLEKQKCLCDSLHQLRIEHQYSQYTLAKKLNIERSTYAAYELGKNLPHIFILERLAEIYGITIDELLHNPNVKSSTN